MQNWNVGTNVWNVHTKVNKPIFFIMSYNQRKFNAILKVLTILVKYNISYREIDEVKDMFNKDSSLD